jgi:hypothetical protein
MLDAYEISDKIKKYWSALYPKNSGEINKAKKQIKVIGVHIQEDMIELELDKE